MMESNELVDLYNLHLNAGKREESNNRLGKKEELIFPTEDERNRIINFFKKHAPLKHWNMELLIARLQRDNPQIDMANIEKLAREDIFWELFHLHLQAQSPEMVVSKMLDAYQTDKGVSWFESPVDFPTFADEYKSVKVLVDGYLQKEIPIESLAWLDMRRAQHTLTTKVEKQNGQQYYLNSLREVDKLHVIDLHTQKLIFVDKENFRYTFGIPLEELFYQIHMQLTMMLQGRLQIKKCAPIPTSRTPACRNIFIAEKKQGPEQQFCSSKCRKRIFEHEKKYPEDRAKRYAILDAKQGK